MSNKLLRLVKGGFTESELLSLCSIDGKIVFDNNTERIYVGTKTENGVTSPLMFGTGIKDVYWDDSNKVLTITKVDGSTSTISISDVEGLIRNHNVSTDSHQDIRSTLNDKANSSDVYTKTEVDGLVSSTFHYKGSKTTYSQLPESGNKSGDVWNIETADTTHGIKAGDNVAWTGTNWDVLSGTVDLSDYYTKTETEALIPVVNNGTLTIQKNGTNITTFDANSSTNETANITVPTKISDLTNDSGFTTNTGTVTSVTVTMNNTTKGTITTSGTIDLGTVLTSHQDISGKENTSNKVSTWSSTTTDSHYPSEKLVKDSLDNKINEPSTEGTAGQVLSTDGNGNRHWVTVSSDSGGSSNLSELIDVNITSITDSDVLSYDSTSGKWINKGEIDPVNLPNFSSSVTGQVLAKTDSNTAEFVTLTNTAPAYINMTGVQAPQTDFYTKGEINTMLSTKQNTLLSGTNIKTINETPVLGSGDIFIPNLSFNHVVVNNPNNGITFDDTLTSGRNRCYARADISQNIELTVSFTNTDEHYITIHNTSSDNVTVAVRAAAAHRVIGNTAITINADKYYEISFILTGTEYILTERQLTTA